MTDKTKAKVAAILMERALPKTPTTSEEAEAVWFKKMEPIIDTMSDRVTEEFRKQIKRDQKNGKKPEYALKTPASPDTEEWHDPYRGAVRLSGKLMTSYASMLRNMFMQGRLDKDSFEYTKELLREVVMFGRSHLLELSQLLDAAEGNFTVLRGMVRRTYRSAN